MSEHRTARLNRRALLMAGLGSTMRAAEGAGPGGAPTATRLRANPIITPASDPSLGANINGPSLIRVPEWVANPLGRYYLYFADHRGASIRLAYADRLEGPWRIHVPGTLHLADSHFTDHIASPDVVIDAAERRIRLYYHGLTPQERAQHTRVALSVDGLHFDARPEPVGERSAYWRVFRYRGWWYSWPCRAGCTAVATA